MARPIDADALKEKYTMVTKRYSGGIMECPAVLLESIDSAPTIDAVSVVRCKECKWAKANGTYQWCGRLDSTARITADDYCSYGEREGE